MKNRKPPIVEYKKKRVSVPEFDALHVIFTPDTPKPTICEPRNAEGSLIDRHTAKPKRK